MNAVFYLSAAIAIIATVMVIIQVNAIHALLYLIVSFLAVSLMFFTLGAPFIAALEVIVYAGAIMVLFVFAIMLLNLGPQSAQQERQWLRASGWIGSAILALILLGELVFVLTSVSQNGPVGSVVEPRQVGIAAFSSYLIGVELASILLLTSLVGANHLRLQRRVGTRPQQPGMESMKNSFNDPDRAETTHGSSSSGKTLGEHQDDKGRNGFQEPGNQTGEAASKER